MKRAVVVPIRWDNVLQEDFGGYPLYHFVLTRLRRLKRQGDTLVIAAADDPETHAFLDGRVKEEFPEFKVYYGDPEGSWERIAKAVSGVDADVIVRATLTQPLFNDILFGEMIQFFEQRWRYADYLYIKKYPSALAFDLIKKETLEAIAGRLGGKSSLIAAGLPIELFNPMEYIPPYNETLAACPSDLRVSTPLDLEIARSILSQAGKGLDRLTIREISELIRKSFASFRFPKRSLSTSEKKAIQKKYQLPGAITFEVISTCILDCEFCILKDLKSWKYRRKTIMTLDEYKRIIDDIAWFAESIDFSGGEPLLHKDIFSMCSYAREKNIYTMISSNNQLLSRHDNLKKILLDPPDEIVIAYDALEKDVYEGIRRKGNFETLNRNLRDLIRLKKEKNAKAPLVTIQMVLTRKNRHMKDDFWKTAKDLGVDRAMIKPLGLWPEAGPEYDRKMVEEYIVPRNEEYISRHDIEGGEPVFIRWPGQCPCAGLGFIGSGGEVIPCYYIIAKTRVMGNALEKGFFQIWNSKRYRDYRKKMLNSWANPLCKRCIGLSSGVGLEIRNYAENNKNSDRSNRIRNEE